jgi:large subunit ribosomal protein L4e
MQTAAESWGTGRAVSRIPRAPGGGTHRAGQGAFGNMCRGGHMFAPTKTWRRWHRKVGVNQKRYAVASALAASAVPALVMARGHRIDAVPEIPLVVDDAAESVAKTAKASALLAALGAGADVARARDARNLRRGKGKLRNRRYVSRRGPLVVYGGDSAAARAFRNIPGVDTASVDRLNLLQLAPGGHLGRFIVWTKSAFTRLDEIFGAGPDGAASSVKAGYRLPRAPMANPDVARLINSDEVQTVVRPPKAPARRAPLKKNPLRNLGALLKVDPHAKAARRAELLKSAKGKVAKKAAPRVATKAHGKAHLAKMVADHDYEGADYEVFSSWLGTTQ